MLLEILLHHDLRADIEGLHTMMKRKFSGLCWLSG